MRSIGRPRILIADDHKLIAEACKSLLEPEFEIVGVVCDGRALLEAVEELRPDIVILDIAMPELNGLDAGERIRRTHRRTKLIYLTVSTGAEVAAEAFRRGASGYVLKHSTAEELIIAVRRVARGESYVSPLITKDRFDFLVRSGAAFPEPKKISERQIEVLQLLAEGKSMKEVAHILQLKPGTVAFHKYRMMEALGVTTNAALIQYALRHHMVA